MIIHHECKQVWMEHLKSLSNNDVSKLQSKEFSVCPNGIDKTKCDIHLRIQDKYYTITLPMNRHTVKQFVSIMCKTVTNNDATFLTLPVEIGYTTKVEPILRVDKMLNHLETRVLTYVSTI